MSLLSSLAEAQVKRWLEKNGVSRAKAGLRHLTRDQQLELAGEARQFADALQAADAEKAGEVLEAVAGRFIRL